MDRALLNWIQPLQLWTANGRAIVKAGRWEDYYVGFWRRRWKIKKACLRGLSIGNDGLADCERDPQKALLYRAGADEKHHLCGPFGGGFRDDFPVRHAV